MSYDPEKRYVQLPQDKNPNRSSDNTYIKECNAILRYLVEGPNTNSGFWFFVNIQSAFPNVPVSILDNVIFPKLAVDGYITSMSGVSAPSSKRRERFIISDKGKVFIASGGYAAVNPKNDNDMPVPGKSEQLNVYCNKCHNETIHTVLSKEEVKGKDSEHPIYWYDSWEILKCMGCLTMCAKHTSWFSEDCRADGKPIRHILYYPRRTDNLLEPDDIENLPSIVKRAYHEAIGAYNANLKLSCAASLRATIDAICSDKEIKSGQVTKDGKTQTRNTLEGKINGLYEKGVITLEQTNFLHETRFLGNDALHEYDVPSSDVLLAAIDIVEHMLISVYEIKERANTLVQRRELKEQLKNKP